MRTLRVLWVTNEKWIQETSCSRLVNGWHIQKPKRNTRITLKLNLTIIICLAEDFSLFFCFAPSLLFVTPHIFTRCRRSMSICSLCPSSEPKIVPFSLSYAYVSCMVWILISSLSSSVCAQAHSFAFSFYNNSLSNIKMQTKTNKVRMNVSGVCVCVSAFHCWKPKTLTTDKKKISNAHTHFMYIQQSVQMDSTDSRSTHFVHVCNFI